MVHPVCAGIGKWLASVIGGRSASHAVEESFEEKGWTDQKYQKACKDCADWIDKIMDYKRAKPKLDKNTTKLIQGCITTLVDFVKNAGRGLTDVARGGAFLNFAQ